MTTQPAPTTSPAGWSWQWFLLIGALLGLAVMGVSCYGDARQRDGALLAKAAAADSVSRTMAARYSHIADSAAKEAARAAQTAAVAQRGADSARVAQQASQAATRAASATAARLRDSLAGHVGETAQLDSVTAALDTATKVVAVQAAVIGRLVMANDSLSAAQVVLLRALGAADTTIAVQRASIQAYTQAKNPGPYWTPLRIAGAVVAGVIVGAAGHAL